MQRSKGELVGEFEGCAVGIVGDREGVLVVGNGVGKLGLRVGENDGDRLGFDALGELEGCDEDGARVGDLVG